MSSSETDDGTGTLTQTTLTGLDFPGMSEFQTIEVRAEGGVYKLRTEGFGTNAGLVNSASIDRGADSAIITLTPGLDAIQLAELVGRIVHVMLTQERGG